MRHLGSGTRRRGAFYSRGEGNKRSFSGQRDGRERRVCRGWSTIMLTSTCALLARLVLAGGHDVDGRATVASGAKEAGRRLPHRVHGRQEFLVGLGELELVEEQ